MRPHVVAAVTFVGGGNAWEIAQRRAARAAAVFEGTPQHFEFQWNPLTAKPGDLAPADSPAGEPDLQWKTGPRMLMTFRIQRAYKGALERAVKIATGLGGGDCGAQFQPGLSYLVYAYGSAPGELSVSMCSPGGWIDSGSFATDLRYLRKERPIASDLTPFDPRAFERLQQQGYKERYAARTGVICGTVIAGAPGNHSQMISFLSTMGHSTRPPTTEVKQDGSFCSQGLGPGRYYLYFTRGLVSALFYPGVVERTKAIAVEVSAGQSLSNIVFKVPTQKMYSVQGFISTNDKSELTEESVSVWLMGLDGATQQALYSQAVDFRGWFPLSKVKYFRIENVLPGHYRACALIAGRGWFTRTVDVDVTTRARFIFLELVHKK